MEKVANISTDETVLVEKCRQGDSAAMERLILKYQNRIYNVILKMCANADDAAELTQETFVKAFFALSKFKEELSFFAWIRRIAVNSTLNYLKIRNREKPLAENNPGPVENSRLHTARPERRLEHKRMEQTFHEALHSLPSDQRAIFILRVYEDQSYQEIAQTLNIPHGTVMSRLSRARQKLKHAMSAYLAGGAA